MASESAFKIDMEVRDNELDSQGIVNNSNYFVYFAHARHKHIKTLGIDFNEMAKQGFNLILIATEMKFKDALKANDKFTVTSKIVPNGRIRINFEQEVIRTSDNKVVTSAINTATCLNTKTRRPGFPEEIKKLLGLD